MFAAGVIDPGACVCYLPPPLAMMSASAGGGEGEGRYNVDYRAPGHDEHISRGPPSRGLLEAPGVPIA